tara:strand:- start:446 stop:619 length:174 start_codon:yes stop_codon:yes gene_type:complete
LALLRKRIAEVIKASSLNIADHEVNSTSILSSLASISRTRNGKNIVLSGEPVNSDLT